jgi:hypothetical protein
LQDGSASVDADKTNILNSMGKDPETGIVDESLMQTNVDLANKAMGGFLAIAAWPNALRRNFVMQFPSVDNTLRLPDVLRADESRKQLEMSFSGLEEADDRQLSLIAQGFPPNLELLTLCFEGCVNITDTGLATLLQAVSKLPLRCLHLDFLGCTRLTNVGVQSLADNLPKLFLTDVKLSFALCSLISERGMEYLAQKVPTSVKRFEANLKGTGMNKEFDTLHSLVRACKTSKTIDMCHVFSS